MCNFCFNNDFERFDDYQAFEKFDSQLDQKRNQNVLVIVDNNTSYLDYYFQILKCNNCNKIWWFSLPENAWRGFFMQEGNAKIKLQNYRKADNRKRLGWFIFILLIVLVIVVYSINN